jgi:hypothetical protein
VKMLVAQALEKRKEDKHDILHTLKIFEEKHEALCRVVFRVKIIVSKLVDEGKMNRVEGSMSLVGTCANLIEVNKDPQ